MLLTAKAPHRGYYRRLFDKARAFRIDMPAKQWCDLWHEHLDWRGHGNHSHADHRHHLRALFLAFARARRELAAQSGSFQIFLNISLRDAGSDALYVHTPNPSGTAFPLDFSDVRELQHVPGLLRGLCSTQHCWVGIQRTGDAVWYVVMSREPYASTHSTHAG